MKNIAVHNILVNAVGKILCFAILCLACTACVTTQPTSNFASVPAGNYEVGGKNHLLNPRRIVQLDAFEISLYEVTNREFAAFVAATGHVTLAEKRHDAMVFYPGLAEFRWKQDSTASWRFPNGISRGGIDDKMDHPVTCISYLDVQAYCKWAGVRLPTLDEWEVATRAGSKSRYYWGNGDVVVPKHANIWHGDDHLQRDTLDPYMYTAPVGKYAANPWGLYDVYGNVFEFCADKPAFLAAQEGIACARGGSWWCSAHACNYFNSIDIGRVKIVASFSNQGFRVVRAGAKSLGPAGN